MSAGDSHRHGPVRTDVPCDNRDAFEIQAREIVHFGFTNLLHDTRLLAAVPDDSGVTMMFTEGVMADVQRDADGIRIAPTRHIGHEPVDMHLEIPKDTRQKIQPVLELFRDTDTPLTIGWAMPNRVTAHFDAVVFFEPGGKGLSITSTKPQSEV